MSALNASKVYLLCRKAFELFPFWAFLLPSPHCGDSGNGSILRCVLMESFMWLQMRKLNYGASAMELCFSACLESWWWSSWGLLWIFVST